MTELKDYKRRTGFPNYLTEWCATAIGEHLNSLQADEGEAAVREWLGKLVWRDPDTGEYSNRGWDALMEVLEDYFDMEAPHCSASFKKALHRDIYDADLYDYLCEAHALAHE